MTEQDIDIQALQSRILELSDRLNKLESRRADTPLYHLSPIESDIRVPAAENLELVSSQATSGATKVALRWVNPQDPTISHYEIWIKRTAYQSDNPYLIASVQKSPAVFTVTADLDTVAVAYVRTVMKNGLGTDLNSSPTVSFNVYKFVAQSADIADGAITDAKFDRVTANKIQILHGDIASLQVGWTGMPGQLSVLNPGGTQIGFIGMHGPRTGTVNTSGTAVTRVSGDTFVSAMAGLPIVIAGTLYTVASVTNGDNLVLTTSAGTRYSAAYTGWIGAGIWAQMAALGGTSFATGVVKSDISGNVSINGATFKLTGNNATTTIDNSSMEGFPAGLKIESTIDTYKSYITTRALRFDKGTTPLIYLTTSTGIGGGINVYNESGQQMFATESGNTKTKTAYYVDQYQVVGARKTAIGYLNGVILPDAGSTYTTAERDLINALKAKVNELVTMHSTVVDRLGITSGHGLTWD